MGFNEGGDDLSGYRLWLTTPSPYRVGGTDVQGQAQCD